MTTHISPESMIDIIKIPTANSGFSITACSKKVSPGYSNNYRQPEKGKEGMFKPQFVDTAPPIQPTKIVGWGVSQCTKTRTNFTLSLAAQKFGVVCHCRMVVYCGLSDSMKLWKEKF